MIKFIFTIMVLFIGACATAAEPTQNHINFIRQCQVAQLLAQSPLVDNQARLLEGLNQIIVTQIGDGRYIYVGFAIDNSILLDGPTMNCLINGLSNELMQVYYSYGSENHFSMTNGSADELNDYIHLYEKHDAVVNKYSLDEISEYLKFDININRERK